MKYEIKGENLPVLICQLDVNETIVCQEGAMSWMSSNMKMETMANGGAKRALGRMLSGESLFQNNYTAQGQSGMIAMAANFPGSIIPFEVEPGKGIIAQKMAFLASEQDVKSEVFFSKKVSSGVFGGEGFIMQRFFGSGFVFMEIDGFCVEYDLDNGEKMIVDTGNLAAMSESCHMKVTGTGGVKNALFGGEGLFNTEITGPGHVWLQTMPISNVASVIRKYLPTTS